MREHEKTSEHGRGKWASAYWLYIACYILLVSFLQFLDSIQYL